MLVHFHFNINSCLVYLVYRIKELVIALFFFYNSSIQLANVSSGQNKTGSADTVLDKSSNDFIEMW